MKRPIVPALLMLVLLVVACGNAAVAPSTALPEVLALSTAEPGIAASIGRTIAVSQVPDPANRPIATLAPLPPPLPSPTPRPTAKPTVKPAATVAAKPTVKPAATVVAKPAATPIARATSRPSVATVKASSFGSGVKVSNYTVHGSTPSRIIASIRANGPRLKWTGRAEAVTNGSAVYRFHLETDGSGSCSIVLDSKAAIGMSISVVLPRWKAPAGMSAATVRWWNSELRQVATHEKVHVGILKAAVKRLNSVLATSSCGNVESRLNKVWAGVRRQNCEFDLKEYGTAQGMSLKACLAG